MTLWITSRMASQFKGIDPRAIHHGRVCTGQRAQQHSEERARSRSRPSHRTWRSPQPTRDTAASSSSQPVPATTSHTPAPSTSRRNKIWLKNNAALQHDTEDDEPNLPELSQEQMDQSKVRFVRLVTYLAHYQTRVVPPAMKLKAHTLSCSGESWPLSKLYLEATFFRQHFRLQVTGRIAFALFREKLWDNVCHTLPTILLDSLLSVIGTAASVLADLFKIGRAHV